MMDEPSFLPTDAVLALVEEIGAAVMMASADDDEEIAAIRAMVERIGAAADERARKASASVLAVLDGAHDVAARTSALGEVATMASELQRCLQEKAAPAPAAAERDAETVELLGDFLQEAEEGLDTVQDILMALEADGSDVEKIHALFRVFHTIKGVAACLEVRDVTTLAHTTETLLDLVRTGELSLEPTHIDLVFESTACLRLLAGGVRSAIGNGGPFPGEASMAGIVSRLEAASTPSGDGGPRHEAGFVQSQAVSEEMLFDDEEAQADSGEADVEVEPVADDDANAAAVAALFTAAPATPAPRAAAPASKHESAPPPAGPAPARSAEGAAPAARAGGKIRETLKVDLARIDDVVELVGELIIVESMVANAPEIVSLASLKIRNYLGQLTKISRDLQNVAMRMRMVPVRGVFQKMARMVRDLGRKTGKDVVLVMSGEAAEMDRSMVEQIEDPLVHMIRNAVDHGLETTADRIKAGKPPQGVVNLSAYHEGGSIVIEISDDGRGLDRERIIAKAKRQGLIRENESLTDAEANLLIFAPGFSTADKLTEISGRGVGMDVVKRSIEALRGRVVVSSVPGKGSIFKMVLPLTLAIIDGMLVSCGTEKYIIPSLSVIESLQPSTDMIRAFAGDKEIVIVRGESMPMLRLRRLFHIQGEEPALSQCRVVVVETIGRKIGLVVDDVVTQQQVVIKPLAGLGETTLLAGAAILADGRVGLILNTDRLSTLFTGSETRARDTKEAAE
jgi:two-component system chemotaxis sensor kinase CheA